MCAPILHDLQFFRDAFPEIKLPDSWGILTSQSDDVIWNVVLAYLNSFLPSDEDELSHRTQCLTGNEEVNENIKHSIEMCNPFLHRDASFCDKEISELVAAFKERVEDYIKNDERLFHNPSKNFGYLEASSKLLSCDIVLISVPFEDKFLVNIFPVQNSRNPRKPYPKHISLFNALKSISGNGIMQYQFSFHIPKEIGIQKQRQALREILKRTRVSDKEDSFDKISELPDITENFFVSLVKNNFWREIPNIYECPDELSKLANAGLDTDPRRKDAAGKSALFYALKTEKSHVVSLVYDHVANPCLQTDTPGPTIVAILLRLREDFKLLEKDLESEEISEKSRCLFRDLCRFHEFQLEMLKNINNIKLRINCYDHTEKEYEILQRKETILIILKSFENYSDYTEGKSSIDAENISLFEECFNKLEFSSAVMFFDNLFLLKERLLFKGNRYAYLNVASDFSLFVFLKKFLERYKEMDHFYLVSRWVISQERLSLQRNLGKFKEILENTELSKDNIVDKLPEPAVLPLTDLPQIYGQFLVSRLQHYLNAATGLIVKGFKPTLVIERCLQVLGECCKESNFNSVQRIITSALSKDLIKYLKEISYSLTHFKSRDLFHRHILEKDESLFRGIRNELVKVQKLLSLIFSAHNIEMRRFLLSHCLESVGRAGRKRRSILKKTQLKCNLQFPEVEENQLSKPTNSCPNTWKCYVADMHSSLRKEINDLNCNGDIFHSHTVSGYKYILQNIIFSIRKVMNNLIRSFGMKSINLEELDSHFWCLESVLTYITTDIKLAEYRKALILMIGDRISLFKELGRNADSFSNVNESMNSIMDESPRWKEINDPNRYRSIYLKHKAETHGIGKHLSSESEDIRDSLLKNFSMSREAELSILKNKAETHGIRKHLSSESEDIHDSLLKNFSMFRKAQRKDVKKVAEKFLREYEKMTDSLFLKIPKYERDNFDFKNIKNCCLLLEGKTSLTAIEKGLVLKSVPEKFRIKYQIQDSFEEKKEFTKPLEDKTFKLYAKNMQKKKMKRDFIDESTCFVEESRDYFTDLIMMMESQELDESECEILCRKLEMPDSAKDILLKLVPTQNKEGNLFEFLRNRIKTLKSILIDDNKSVQQLWERATTPRKRMHVTEKIVQLFLNDSATQASVEMLLSDCKTILRSKDLTQLWKKTTNLFNGINLRNVLVPDCIPQLKSLGRLLDPYDLASEIVEKMLQLISDENVMDCMQQILDQSGTDFSDFMQIMDDEKNEQLKNLREQILDCDHWEEYALLIPFSEVRPL
ncbi:hypothetical protein AVEN_74240-1 [Araneus ventricosus]|uniref:Uncharacterized protein n=1 Tax=Araneus ventricosus TaxID=182803 RepID=A0A4Y2EUU7_ARAVE|nr:hypothetical protein AVEN_74240-1 [Araneus ventricosus]